jgi:hypothetical protein
LRNFDEAVRAMIRELNAVKDALIARGIEPNSTEHHIELICDLLNQYNELRTRPIPQPAVRQPARSRHFRVTWLAKAAGSLDRERRSRGAGEFPTAARARRRCRGCVRRAR